MAQRDNFTAADAGMRIVAAMALAAATWNPSGWSFAGWAMAYKPDALPMLALAGVSLAILWVIYLRATLRSLGPFGVTLAAAFFAAAFWVLLDIGALTLSSGAFAWAALVGVGFVLGLGLSWSHVRRRLSGQADVDDVN